MIVELDVVQSMLVLYVFYFFGERMYYAYLRKQHEKTVQRFIELLPHYCNVCINYGNLVCNLISQASQDNNVSRIIKALDKLAPPVRS